MHKRLLFLLLILLSFSIRMNAQQDCYEGSCMLCVLNQEKDAEVVNKLINELGWSPSTNPFFDSYEGYEGALIVENGQVTTLTLYPDKFLREFPLGIPAYPDVIGLTAVIPMNLVEKLQNHHTYRTSNDLVISCSFDQNGSIQILNFMMGTDLNPYPGCE